MTLLFESYINLIKYFLPQCFRYKKKYSVTFTKYLSLEVIQFKLYT